MRVSATVSPRTEIALRRIAAFRLQTAHAQLLVDATAIAEGLVDELVNSLFNEHATAKTPMAKFLLGELNGKFNQNWKSRHSVLTKAFGLDLDQKIMQQMDSVIQVRNAFVHGDGGLSPNQSHSWKEIFRLRRDLSLRLGIQIDGTRLHFGENTITIALSYVDAYLLELDRATTAAIRSWPQQSASE